MDDSRAVYGIDLGTTYSCIAQVDNYDQAVVRRNFEGNATTPSVVYFQDQESYTVGEEAKSQLVVEPEKTVSFVKRSMGVDDDFDKTKNSFPYNFDPSEVSALILKKLVADANAEQPEPIKDVVITCPAYFGTKERMQTKQAGEIAGLNVLGIINEPVAAAISYGVRLDQAQTILVYDLGGGTFDVTAVRVDNGTIKVVATGGDHHLGGVDWDTLLAEYLLLKFNQEFGTDYTMEDPIIKFTLLDRAEKTKKTLSSKDTAKAPITIDGKTYRAEINRETFDALTEDKLNETITEAHKVIDIAAEKGFKVIDEIILVGGSSKMPQVKERVESEFGLTTKIVDPDECVAKGAAIYAMNDKYALAIEEWEEGEIDEKPKAISGDRTRVVNVTSKTYGTDMIDHDGALRVQNMIFANSTLPISYTQRFLTTTPNQRGVSLKVYESDFTDELADAVVDPSNCILLKEEALKITSDWAKGTPISVTFSIDTEGILSVSAFISDDRIDFTLEIQGVKNDEELNQSKGVIENMKEV